MLIALFDKKYLISLLFTLQMSNNWKYEITLINLKGLISWIQKGLCQAISVWTLVMRSSCRRCCAKGPALGLSNCPVLDVIMSWRLR